MGILFFAVANFAIAASSSVFVSPANLEIEKGQSFDLSVKVDGAGQKICVVEGKINFSNLSCRSISISDGLWAQTSPTCVNSYFLVGIQGCDSAVRNLFTVNVETINSGNAGIGLSDIDIVGEGVSISNTSTGGNYIIITPVVALSNQSQSPAVKSNPKTTPENSENQAVPQQIEDQIPNLITSITPVVSEKEAEQGSASLLASMANILSFGTGKAWLSTISAMIVLIILGSGAIYLAKKIRKKQV